jgi:lipopolysaccharide export LptBFGC system permease protein LptF
VFDTLARYVLSQCGARFLLLFTIFLLVLVGGQLGIFISQGVPPEACLPIVEQLVEVSLPIALPLALATSILVIIGAMNQEGELRALASSGVSHLAVVVRVLPLVAVAMVACLALTNIIMPNAVAGIRGAKGRLYQTLIAQKVAIDEAVMEKGGFSVWVGAADGDQLKDIRALVTRSQDEFVAVFAPRAHWSLSSKGINLVFEDAQLMQRRADGRLVTIDAPVWPYLWEGDQGTGQSEPDGMPTARVLELVAHPPPAGADLSNYNNARLTLHFRFFLPASLLAFALLAIGIGLTYGTSQNLPGVVIMVVVVALTIYPAFGYVKTNVSHAQINPGWLLWPPAGVVAAFGLWLLWRPERSREILGLPYALAVRWWQGRA